METATIVSKAYDLLKYSIPVFARYPRAHKFTLGDRQQAMLSDLLDLIIEAYYAPTGEKRALLRQANVLLEKLRHYFRLGFELGIYDSGRYREFSVRTDEIGRMAGGWMKTLPA